MADSDAAATSNSNPLLLPELCVFDLDACFWDQEMYEMPQIPTEKDIVRGPLLVVVTTENKEEGSTTTTTQEEEEEEEEGVIGVLSGGHQISMHKGSLFALQNHIRGNVYPGMKVAFASSADTPFAEQIGRATLKLLEVVPGTTVWDLVVGRDWEGQDVNQIGRQPPLLSSNKAKSHFPRLKEMTGIRYDRMLFFDDCNWGDHCLMVRMGCKEDDTQQGPVTVRTPNGLTVQLWEEGLKRYAEQAKQLQEQQQE